MEHELIVGEIYYVCDDHYWMIGKHIGGDRDDLGYRVNDNAIVINKEQELNECNWCYYKEGKRQYRLATEEGRMWLLSCIEKGKYMSKEEALKHYNTYSIY